MDGGGGNTEQSRTVPGLQVPEDYTARWERVSICAQSRASVGYFFSAHGTFAVK